VVIGVKPAYKSARWTRPKGESTMRLITDFIFLVLFFVFLIGWLLAWAAFHVAGGMIHLLIVIAVIFLIVHFVRGRSSTV
jgi:uncharacterized membrane protein (DUF485 family)